MNALGQRIAQLIGAQGPISIAQFMTIALHDPQGGYYATHDPFGARGDFITAPEVSQMFGELLGLWVVKVWQDQGRHAPARLVELGPGRGTLTADALRAAKLMPEFLAAIDVAIVEASATLQAMQAEKLKDSGVKVSWATRFEDVTIDRPTFVIANEFFDALPVRQYVKTDRGWCERMVVAKNGALEFAVAPVSSLMSPEGSEDAPIGAIYEAAPSATAIVEQIARAIADKAGAALIVDYGYDKADFGETLQAVGGHAFRQVLETPGEIDISAHVNFSALTDAALNADAVVYGPVTQREFLSRLGIVSRADMLAAHNPAMRDELDAAVERLVGGDQMGLLFKAMAIMPNDALTPPGF